MQIHSQLHRLEHQCLGETYLIILTRVFGAGFILSAPLGAHTLLSLLHKLYCIPVFHFAPGAEPSPLIVFLGPMFALQTPESI